eukprot:GGOE01012411.1.p2 GENE.GGOE01012411.1~~GGOE01012411.1.p2  ORF type:complete len:217 (-),score=2.52 GGOE01012411.1:133-783(-)
MPKPDHSPSLLPHPPPAASPPLTTIHKMGGQRITPRGSYLAKRINTNEVLLNIRFPTIRCVLPDAVPSPHLDAPHLCVHRPFLQTERISLPPSNGICLRTRRTPQPIPSTVEHEAHPVQQSSTLRMRSEGALRRRPSSDLEVGQQLSQCTSVPPLWLQTVARLPRKPSNRSCPLHFHSLSCCAPTRPAGRHDARLTGVNMGHRLPLIAAHMAPISS